MTKEKIQIFPPEEQKFEAEIETENDNIKSINLYNRNEFSAQLNITEVE